MTGILSSIVRILFSAPGADKTVGEIGGVTQSVKNLTSASAGAHRAFSDQQRGLGGLVGAYAAAAATTFALQQAFAALKKSAEVESVKIGFEQLSRSVGINGKELLTTINAITKGQLSLASAAELTATGVAGGLGADQLAQLSSIAAKASVVLGRDMTDAYSRLIKGVSKLEPELLDELGIFTRIDPAVAKYAQQLGKAATQLTVLERKQAFANAVIEEGALKYSEVGTSAGTSLESLNRFIAKLTDTAQAIGIVFAQIFAGIFDKLTEMSGLVVGLASYMFSKLIQVAKAGLLAVGASLSAGGHALADKLISVTPAGIEKAKAITNLQALPIPTSLSRGGDLNNKELSLAQKHLDLIKEGKLATAQVAQIRATTTNLQANELIVQKKLTAEVEAFRNKHHLIGATVKQRTLIQEKDFDATKASRLAGFETTRAKAEATRLKAATKLQEINARTDYASASSKQTQITKNTNIMDAALKEEQAAMKRAQDYRSKHGLEGATVTAIALKPATPEQDRLLTGKTEAAKKAAANAAQLAAVSGQLETVQKSGGAAAGAISSVGNALSNAASAIAVWGGRLLSALGVVAMGISLLDVFAQLLGFTGVSTIIDGIGKFFGNLVERLQEGSKAAKAFFDVLTSIDEKSLTTKYGALGVNSGDVTKLIEGQRTVFQGIAESSRNMFDFVQSQGGNRQAPYAPGSIEDEKRKRELRLLGLSSSARGLNPGEVTNMAEEASIASLNKAYAQQVDLLKDKLVLQSSDRGRASVMLEIEALRLMKEEYETLIVSVGGGSEIFRRMSSSIAAIKKGGDFDQSSMNGLIITKRLWMEAGETVISLDGNIRHVYKSQRELNEALKNPGLVQSLKIISALDAAMTNIASGGTADSLDERIKGIEAAVKAGTQKLDAAEQVGGSGLLTKENQGLVTQIELAKQRLEPMKEFHKNLQATEKWAKFIQDHFASSLKTFEQLVKLGKLTSGGFAANKEEEQFNITSGVVDRYDYYARQLTTYNPEKDEKELKKLQASPKRTYDNTRQIQINAAQTRVGEGKNLEVEIEKLLKIQIIRRNELKQIMLETFIQETKQIKALEAQNEELKYQISLTVAQHKLAVLNANNQAANDRIALEQKYELLVLETKLTQISAVQATIENNVARLNSTKELIAAQHELKAAIADSNKQGIDIQNNKLQGGIERMRKLADVSVSFNEHQNKVISLMSDAFNASADVSKGEITVRIAEDNLATQKKIADINMEVANKNVELAQAAITKAGIEATNATNKIEQEAVSAAREQTNRLDAIAIQKIIVERQFDLENLRMQNVKSMQEFELGLIQAKQGLLKQEFDMLQVRISSAKESQIKELALQQVGDKDDALKISYVSHKLRTGELSTPTDPLMAKLQGQFDAGLLLDMQHAMDKLFITQKEAAKLARDNALALLKIEEKGIEDKLKNIEILKNEQLKNAAIAAGTAINSAITALRTAEEKLKLDKKSKQMATIKAETELMGAKAALAASETSLESAAELAKFNAQNFPQQREIKTLNGQQAELNAQISLTEKQHALNVLNARSQAENNRIELEQKIKMLDLEISLAGVSSARAKIEGNITRLNATKDLISAQHNLVAAIGETNKQGIDIQNNKLQASLDRLKKLGDTFGLLTEHESKVIGLVADAFNASADVSKNEITVMVAQDSLDTEKRIADINVEVANKNFALAQASLAESGINALVAKERIEQETANAIREQNNRLKALDAQDDIVRKQFFLEKLRIDNIKDMQKFELMVIGLRNQLLEKESENIIANARVALEIERRNRASTLSKDDPTQFTAILNNLISGQQDNGKFSAATADAREVNLRQTLIKSLDTSAVTKLQGSIIDTQTRIATRTMNDAISISTIQADAHEAEIAGLEKIRKKRLELVELQTSTEASRAKAAEDAAKTAVLSEEQKREVVIKNKKRELEAAEATLEASKLNLAFTLKMLELSKDNLFAFAVAAKKIAIDNLTKGLEEFNQAIIDGTLTFDSFTQGFRSWLYSLTVDLQKALFKATIIEPVTNWVSAQLGATILDLFNIDTAMDPKTRSLISGIGGGATLKNIVDSVLSLGGPSSSSGTTPGTTTPIWSGSSEQVMRSGTTAGTAQDEGDKAKTATEGLVEITRTASTSFMDFGIVLGGTMASILASGGNFKTALLGTFASIFSQILLNLARTGSVAGAGGLSGLFSGIASWFGGGASGGGASASAVGPAGGALTSLGGTGGTVSFGFAAGGPVRPMGSVRYMATGGRYGRDSVSAMLEPGEFVMRRQAAQSIGLPALQSMNASGGMQPDISVNVTNNGTPQNVQGKPKMSIDGRKMIIDVVLQDIANNGPIRRNLRGGL